MALNNTVTLTGNIGAEARMIETDSSQFAAFSLATTDSYKDAAGQWQNRETVWHQLLTFNPKLISMLKTLKKGARLTITGSINYRSFEIPGEDGKPISKSEARIIAHKIEPAPLARKEKGAA